jgi:hypothetical protein
LSGQGTIGLLYWLRLASLGFFMLRLGRCMGPQPQISSPQGATGSVLGFWTIFYGIGLTLAPTLGGYIADLTGTFTWSFLLAAVTGVGGTFFVSRIKKPGDLSS